MLCDNCRENEATVRYTEIINGNKREMMLCEECSRKLGINKMSLKLPIDFSSFFGDFLSEYEKNDLLPLFSSTSLPDIFFTEYLPEANGDYLKVYLYILFCF